MGKRRIWHLSGSHHEAVFKTRVLHFKFENTPMKDTNGKKKLKKNAQIPFCGQTRAFRYEIVFRGIHPCLVRGGSERLAFFEPTDAARFLKKHEVLSVLYGQGKYVF